MSSSHTGDLVLPSSNHLPPTPGPSPSLSEPCRISMVCQVIAPQDPHSTPILPGVLGAPSL